MNVLTPRNAGFGMAWGYPILSQEAVTVKGTAGIN